MSLNDREDENRSYVQPGFGDDPYARISPFKGEENSGKLNLQDSPNGDEELNPPPPVKVCARSISALESRLLNLASKPPSEPNESSRSRNNRDGSPSDNDSIDRKREKSASKRRSSRSPRRNSSGRKSRSKSPRKKNRSPSRRSRKSRSRSRSRTPKRKSSPKKKSSRDASRSPRSSKRSRSRSPRKRRRSSSRRRRSRSRNRRSSRSRSRSTSRKRRSRSRSKDRNGGRRRRSRSYSRSRSPKISSHWGQKPVGKSEGGKKKEITTEDVEKRLAQHMKSVQEKQAEEAKKINLPGYLNPAMVNVHQFKQIQDKRKLLWGKQTKDEVGTKGTKWAGAFGDGSSEDKFRRLMGINEAAATEGKGAQSEAVQQSRKVLNELEEEYEKARAFQLSRGAGGVTGIGLGFASATVPPHPYPPHSQPPPT